MEDVANSNAGLMRRIVQLEREKSELQQDIETLCMQQSGFSGSMDIVSRMQARRAAGFEQELEACKQKLDFHTKENLNLREELEETYRVKGRVADAFKAAMDKNKELEKEVKFYQSRMSGAFNERDKAVLEVERLHATEKTTMKELRELRHRLEQIKAECCEQEKSYTELQQSVQIPILELKKVQKVVEKFWKLRESAKENGGLHEECVDKVQVLLEEDDANWVYGPVSDGKFEKSCGTAELALAQVKDELALSKATSTRLEEELSLTESTSAKLREELDLLKLASAEVKEELLSSRSASLKLEEELDLMKATSTDLKLQLEGECVARKDAAKNSSMILGQLVLSKHAIEKELQQLRAQQIILRTTVSTFVDAEKRQVSLMQESLHALEKVKSDTVQQDRMVDLEGNEDSVLQNIPHGRKGLRVHFEDEGPSQGTSISKDEDNFDQPSVVKVTDDSRQILAQALQEKVEALLLLSQQEERYYLEASTQSALESQVTVLNQKLAQVTGEKVKALMDLAEERQQIQQLQDRERDLTKWLEQKNITYPSGEQQHDNQSERRVSSLPGGASISQAIEDKPVIRTKNLFAAGGGYFKGWLQGLDISAFKATPTLATSNSSVSDMTPGSKSDIGNSVARLLVENATLQERVASMRQLAKSAHRLRMILVKVATESKGQLAPPSIQSAIKVVESVKFEATQLTAALGCALPVSFQGPLESSPGNSDIEPSSEGILEGDNGETEGASNQDSVSMAGIEIAELVLAIADLQTESLQAMLNLAHTD